MVQTFTDVVSYLRRKGPCKKHQFIQLYTAFQNDRSLKLRYASNKQKNFKIQILKTACMFNRTEIVGYLIHDANIDSNIEETHFVAHGLLVNHPSAFFVALAYSNKQIIKTMLENGINLEYDFSSNVHSGYVSYKRYINLALAKRTPDIVDLLFQYGAKITSRSITWSCINHKIGNLISILQHNSIKALQDKNIEDTKYLYFRGLHNQVHANIHRLFFIYGVYPNLDNPVQFFFDYEQCKMICLLYCLELKGIHVWF
jgi:hypothetical protein